MSRLRNRIVKRVEHPDGARIYWATHFLSGAGKTPEAARANFERLLRELAEDGLEIVGRVPAAKGTSTRAHSSESMGADLEPDLYRFGYEFVRLQVVGAPTGPRGRR